MAKPAGGGEHDKGDINVTKNREFVGLLDEPIPTLGKGDLPVRGVLYLLYLQLHRAHDPLTVLTSILTTV